MRGRSKHEHQMHYDAIGSDFPRRYARSWGCTGLKHLFGYDDALDAFGVHAVGGAVGALLTGVFAIEQYGVTAGLIEGNVAQVINQIEGILIVFIYDAVASYIILK